MTGKKWNYAFMEWHQINAYTSFNAQQLLALKD
jgi:hypothetical protein